jgi:predicted dehydrogenase
MPAFQFDLFQATEAPIMSRKNDISRRKMLGQGFGAASMVVLGGCASFGKQGTENQKADSSADKGQKLVDSQSDEKPAPRDQQADDIRCGMIGTGGRGTGVLKAIDKVPGVRVTALCDINKKNLENAAGKVEHDSPELFEDYRKLIDKKDLDAIFVETPCYLHAEMMIAVLESGRHCYGEKPMALTVKDLNAVVRAEKRAGKVFQIGTQLRYASPWQSAIELIQAGKLGKPVLIRAHRNNSYDLPHDRKWFFKRKLSGDPILEQAVHEFDLFNWIFGRLPRQISGFGGQAVHFEPEGRDIMDHYVLAMDYGKNKKVSYHHSWISAPKVPFDDRQEVVYCEKAVVDVEGGMVYPKDGQEPYKVDPEPKGNPTQLAVTDFFRCIREGDRPLANVETGRDCVLVGLLGREAIDRGEVVTMKQFLKKHG